MSLRITAVFGDYYIGGRQFDRLETLISYYMYYSELVKGEKLLNPVAPPIACRLEKTYLSIKAFKNSSNQKSKSQLSLISNTCHRGGEEALNCCWDNSEDILYVEQVGQRFRVFHEIDEADWYWAQCYETNECGILFADCVVPVVSLLFFKNMFTSLKTEI